MKFWFHKFLLGLANRGQRTRVRKNQFTFCNRLRATADVTKNGELGNRCQGDSCLSRKRDGQRARKGRDMYAHNLGVVCVWGDVAGRLLCIFGRAQKRVQVRLDLGGQQWRARRSRVVKAIKVGGALVQSCTRGGFRRRDRRSGNWTAGWMPLFNAGRELLFVTVVPEHIGKDRVQTTTLTWNRVVFLATFWGLIKVSQLPL